MRVPDKVAREAAKLRAQGKTEDQIVAVYLNRYTWAQIKAGIDRRNRQKNTAIGFNLSKLGLDIGVAAKPIPQDVREAAARRSDLCHTSLTARLQGDPLPGDSALDKRSTTLVPDKIYSDPLDGLIYGRIKAV